MAHGGYRKGAGRKKGVSTKKTREVADRALADGITPLEVMLHTMREYYALAQSAEDALERGRCLEAACNAAKDAAPYVHPRLSTVAHGGDKDAPPINHNIVVQYVDSNSDPQAV